MRMKKIATLGLAAAAVVGLAACSEESAGEYNARINAAVGNTGDNDLDIYNAAVGDFSTEYAAADAESNPSKRYVAMAKSEAELLYSGIFTPTTTQGGNYALGSVAPHSVPYALWGTDEYRLKNTVVANKTITKADRDAMLAEWTTKRGTDGFDYEEYCKTYLTSHGYTVKNTYNTTYTEDAATFDWLATSMASDSEILMNFVDGLVEYNGEGEVVPALASSWEVSTDGKTYTFHIRNNASWVNVDGTKYADVTAKDFVTGFQHMLDAEGGLEWLVQGVIKNADEYLTGAVTDFAQVGVKAVDDYTLEYTLTEACPYFLTYLSYNIYQPLNEAYFKSKGGALGRQAFADAKVGSSYTYGTSRENIAYCGAYTMSNLSAQSSLTYSKNASYWDAANVSVETITMLYNDGSDALKSYNLYKDGNIDAAGLNTAAIAQAKADNKFANAYITDTTATTYFAAYNLNRQTYASEDGAVRSSKTAEQAVASDTALNNQYFRLALACAFDKATWNAQSVGDELKNNALRNSYTPYNFVTLTESVTTTIGTTSKTYPAGTAYGVVLEDALEAKLGYKVNLQDSQDGWYNPTKAQAWLTEARKTIGDGEIVLDVVYQSTSEVSTNQAQSYKASVEAALEGVKVNLVAASTRDAYLASGYRAANGAAANYDVFYGSGWGPDYGDPKTYLDTFLAEGAGYMTKTIGLW